MKLKINKACDLSSISVLPPPPQTRRLSSVQSGPQAPQLRSQQSQQSYSQGISSQHGLFSQFSQTSLDEALTSDQEMEIFAQESSRARFNSQERENSLRKPSCLPLVNLTREESEMQLSRSSTNLMRRWNPTSAPDHKCHINEELEHRIGMMETSLNKFGMMLDSVQSDVMQVNKGTKEVTLEMEGIRQKLSVLDNSLQLMSKGQEDVKCILDGSLKSISEQLCKDTNQDKLQQIFLVLSALPEQIEASLLKLQNKIHMTFTKEIKAMAFSMKSPTQRSPPITALQPKVTGRYGILQGNPESLQAMAFSMKSPTQRSPSITALQPKVTGGCGIPQRNPESFKKNPTSVHTSLVIPPKVCSQATAVPKVEMGHWNSVKVKQSSIAGGPPRKEQKCQELYSVEKSRMQEKPCSRIVIDSDEEIDEGFSFLIDEKKTGIGNHIIDEAKDETARILRKARRRKRKSCNPVIIL